MIAHSGLSALRRLRGPLGHRRASSTSGAQPLSGQGSIDSSGRELGAQRLVQTGQRELCLDGVAFFETERTALYQPRG